MRIRAAVVQATPAPFDRARTLEKLGRLVAEAARQGAELAVFPEAFVSGYPKGLDFGAVVGRRTREGRDHFRRYFESAVAVPGPDVDLMAKLAREHRLHLVVGVIERDGGTLYCTVLFFGEDGIRDLYVTGVQTCALPISYFKLGKYDAAEQNLIRASQRQESDPTINEHLADLYQKTGRLKLAATHWERALVEWGKTVEAEVDPADVARIQKKLDAVRVRLAKETPERR